LTLTAFKKQNGGGFTSGGQLVYAYGSSFNTSLYAGAQMTDTNDYALQPNFSMSARVLSGIENQAITLKNTGGFDYGHTGSPTLLISIAAIKVPTA